MKIIALMPVKNEEWILPTTLKELSRYIDDLVVLDDSDQDNSRSVIKKYGGHLINQNRKKISYSSWRSDLLKKGRELGGTHFIWLDADESFSNNFYNNYVSIFKSLKPGQALNMEWICLWKSAFKQRFDNSIWVKNYKDFVFCDDQISDFNEQNLHENRTPVKKNRINNIKLPCKFGNVLHFQFVPFKRFQEKQAFIASLDFLSSNKTATEINKRYSITLDSPNIRLKNVPKDWIINFNNKNLIRLEKLDDSYFLNKLLWYFKKYGVKKFEQLEIWHIEKLKAYFTKFEGRTPIPIKYKLSFKEKLSNIKRQILKFIHKHIELI